MIGTLCCDRPACDTVTDVAKARVRIQDFGWSGLKSSGEFEDAPGVVGIHIPWSIVGT